MKGPTMDKEEYKAKKRKEREEQVDLLQKQHINLCYELGNIKYRMAIDEKSAQDLIARIQQINQEAHKIKMKLGVDDEPDSGSDSEAQTGQTASDSTDPGQPNE
jgi:ArsR family metal-binding transcriptional regulator